MIQCSTESHQLTSLLSQLTGRCSHGCMLKISSMMIYLYVCIYAVYVKTALGVLRTYVCTKMLGASVIGGIIHTEKLRTVIGS